MVTLQPAEKSEAKNRSLLIVLAFVGALQPTPIPLTFLHKLYLGQYGWGVVYFLLGFTQIPRIACAVEGFWYLLNPDATTYSGRWSHWLTAPSAPSPASVDLGQSIIPTTPDLTCQMATALRELEQLRQEGLLSEYEFEQKRRKVLELD